MISKIKRLFEETLGFGNWSKFWLVILYGMVGVLLLIILFVLLMLFLSLFSKKIRKWNVKVSFKLYRNWHSSPKVKTTLVISFVLLLIILLLFFSPIKKLWPDFFGALTNTLTTAFIAYMYFLVIVFFEDKHKVTESKDVLKIYYKDNYSQKFKLKNGKEIDFMYDTCSNGNQSQDVFKRISIVKSKSEYELPDFVSGNFQTLFSAHKGSFKKNLATIRIKDFKIKDENLTLEVEKSTFYNHLVTNRALDLTINKFITLRDLYEFGPFLNPLNTSLLSNHLGIIGFIETSDNYIIINERSRQATTSKNKFVSSLAFGLNIPEETMTSRETLSENHILNELKVRVKRNTLIDQKHIESIKYLGFGRDVYEGGKPHLFVHIKVNISSSSYLKSYQLELSSILEKKVNNNKNNETVVLNYERILNELDKNKALYLVKYDELDYLDDELVISGYQIKGSKVSKLRKQVQRYAETNMLMCLNLLINYKNKCSNENTESN